MYVYCIRIERYAVAIINTVSRTYKTNCCYFSLIIQNDSFTATHVQLRGVNQRDASVTTTKIRLFE